MSLMRMRGTAMIETAIVLSTVLLLLFGIMELAVYGYDAATSEGAAFVAAHAASVNSSGTLSTDKAYGLSVANLAFPSVDSGHLDFTYPQSNVIQAIVRRNASGMLLVPGSDPFTLRGGTLEPILANTAYTGNIVSGFGVQATLSNYCYYTNSTTWTCPGRSLYITQYDDLYGKGNGKNGQFGEWKCRPSLFEAYGGSYFTTAYPTTGGYNTIYDPHSATFGGTGKSKSQEAPLYSFDTQTSSWGTTSSC